MLLQTWMLLETWMLWEDWLQPETWVLLEAWVQLEAWMLIPLQSPLPPLHDEQVPVLLFSEMITRLDWQRDRSWRLERRVQT